MKKKLIYSGIMLIIAIIFLIPISYGAYSGSYDFAFNYDVSGLPYKHGNETVYCMEHHTATNGFLSGAGMVYFKVNGRGNLDTRLALALTEPNVINNDKVKQQIIWQQKWQEDIKNMGATPSASVNYITANNIINRINNSIIYDNPKFEIKNTNPKLVSNNNGVYTVVPFIIKFDKGTYSDLEKVVLKDNNGNEIPIRGVKFSNGYVGNINEIGSEDKFYLLFNASDVNNVKSVKLSAEYKFVKATGTYVKYKPVGSETNRYKVSQLQYVVGITVSRENVQEEIESPSIELTMDLAGRVFIDVPIGKAQEPNGILDKQDTELAEEIKVTLYEKGTNIEIAWAKTKGKFEFKNVSATKEYYVVFEYNGMTYMPTTYQTLKKYTDATTKVDTAISERSFGSEKKAERESFNNKFGEITGSINKSDLTMKAYADMNAEGIQKYYNVSNTEETLKNINLGLVTREQFDFNLRKDLYDIDMNINGINHKYEYDSAINEDMTIEIRGSDLPQYERGIRKSDITYTGNNKLDISLTYKIVIKNQTQGSTKGEVTQLVDWFDSDYTYVSSYYTYDRRNAENNRTDITNTWSTPERVESSELNDAYNKMTTSGLQGNKVKSGESIYVYVTFKLNDNALADLLNKDDIKENYAEIGGYKTYHGQERKDHNGITIYKEDQIAGVIDVDSTPRNFNPLNRNVRNFVEYSRTDAYKNKSEEDKWNESKKIFEDDADMAPGLHLKLLNDPRTLSGNAWEDAALIEKLSKDNLRIGNGTRENEQLIEGVIVQLVNQDNGEVVLETTTNAEGAYKFEGYIPGRYYVRFKYGKGDTLSSEKNNGTRYSGQDYKSTIFNEEAHNESTYWYTEHNNLSDAKDNWNRREEVNAYSKLLRNTKAEVLHYNNIEELEKLDMYADTPKMLMEIEYARNATGSDNKDTSYTVSQVDFGIIERPRAELKINKTVKHIKVTTTDGQILFDDGTQVKNLTWGDEQKTAIIDNNLINGSKIEITYEFSINNIGERDFADPNFYYYGNIDESKVVKTKASEVIDYVSTNLDYDQTREENSEWSIVSKETVQTENENTLIKNDIVINDAQTIIKANGNNPLVNKELKPGETTGVSAIVLTRVMGTTGTDPLVYENIVEIVETQNAVGRKLYSSIPGNLDPENPTFEEPDQTNAQEVIILPPYGGNNITYYVMGAILLAIIVGGGIFLIKKKVLTK